MPIPVIDLFAGPGGLGEGFSAFRRDGRRVFKIAVSIEKDPDAHRTLELRSFFRQFPDGEAPREYYDYLAGKTARADLFAAHPAEARHARTEAWHATLGVTAQGEIDARISAALAGRQDWLLIGGPPCQAYSLVGRSKIIGEIGREEYEADHRHFLYREYLRIIADFRPRVFVMENVKGLLSARVNNESTLTRILADLQHPLVAMYGPRHRRGDLSYQLFSLAVPPSELFGAYDPGDFIVHAEDYGVPQARHRLIIVGIVENVTAPPGLLTSQPQLWLRFREWNSWQSSLSSPHSQGRLKQPAHRWFWISHHFLKDSLFQFFAH